MKFQRTAAKKLAGATVAAASMSMLVVAPAAQSQACVTGQTNPDYCITAQDVKALQKADAKAIAALLKNESISKFIKDGKVSLTFTVPGRGTLTITFTVKVPIPAATPRTASIAKTKTVVLAKGVRTTTNSGKAKVIVKLTPAGKKILRSAKARHKSVTVTPTVKFKPKTGKTTTTKVTPVKVK